MAGPMSAPNGQRNLVEHPEARLKLHDSGKLVTGKTAVKHGRAQRYTPTRKIETTDNGVTS